MSERPAEEYFCGAITDAAITHQYFIQNVGVLGNVNQEASVHNNCARRWVLGNVCEGAAGNLIAAGIVAAQTR